MKTTHLLGIVALVSLLSFVPTVPAAKKNNAETKSTADRTRGTRADNHINPEVTDTETRNSPSVSPNRDAEAAPTWEGQAPPSAPVDNSAAFSRTVVQPQMSTSARSAYTIDWYSINGGGVTDASSASYRMGATIGQSVAGEATSASYQLGIGFWYGGGGGGGGCACDCHGDPGGNCDGVQTVLDVVQTVNVAFRNAAAIPDPNTNCPYQTTDVNCDDVTTVIDVVKIVNVAFRNANKATEFCNPCP